MAQKQDNNPKPGLLLPDKIKGVRYAWLEITPSCMLRCKHCYLSSQPGLGHGNMTLMEWKKVAFQLSELGCKTIQFIGGEPTIHPDFCELLDYTAGLGVSVSVYSNLVKITPAMWQLFSEHQVHLECSYYTDVPDTHDEITGVIGSFKKTTENIKKAISLGLKLSVGMIDVQDNQRINEGKSKLIELGVEEKEICIDRVRGVGRGSALRAEDKVDSLCGACAKSKCVVTASGDVFPCVFSRSFHVGNVHNSLIADIIYGPTLTDVRQTLTEQFAGRSDKCSPVRQHAIKS